MLTIHTIQPPTNFPPKRINAPRRMAMPPALPLHLGRVLRRRAGAAADAQLPLLPAAARLLEGALPGG